MIVNEKQAADIHEILAFAEKTVYIRTGVRLRMFCNATAHKADEVIHPPAAMLQTIAVALGTTIYDLQAKNRQRNTVEVRQISSLLLHKYYPTITLRTIGSLMGYTEHTTVTHSMDKANQLLHHKNQHFTIRYTRAAMAVEKWLSHHPCLP